jgi:cellulose synthase/poly-beta-1,6-N-acetylglucosamine synthase-like glycosyltransferase
MAASHTDDATTGTTRSRRFTRSSTGARRARGHEGRFARSNPHDTHVEAPGTGLVIYQPHVEPGADPEPIAGTALERFAARAGRLAAGAALAFRRAKDQLPKSKTAKIVVVVPAHNEEATIGRTVEALLAQTRRPDRIVVMADNCSDRTVEIASSFGRHVTVVETVANKDRKVGALTQAWQQYVAEGYDYMLGVDADTVLSPNSLADLEQELEENPKVGGVMARYTFDPAMGASKWARLLIRMQRMEFSSWTLDMLHRKRNTYVLGGQATLFRVTALQEVVEGERRFSPWDKEAQVEDMELTWALAARNWETKVSQTARAYAGPMFTVKSLWAQRRKWDEGMARLLLGSKLGAATIYPWRMQFKMLVNGVTRTLFLVLLGSSVAVGAFAWNWIWIAPPILAALLNFKHARKIPGHTRLDLFLATTLVAVELYLVFRLFVWTTSWATVIAGIRRDGWARQYKAEGLPAGQTQIARGEVL